MSKISPQEGPNFFHRKDLSNLGTPPGLKPVPGQEGVYYDPATGTFFYKKIMVLGDDKYKAMTSVGKTSSGYEVYMSKDDFGSTHYYEKDPTALYPGTDIPVLYGPFDHNPCQ